MSLQQELLRLIESWDLKLGGELTPDTPLIRSGLFDSLALFNLVQWIERQIGAPVDPTTLDLVEEWDSVKDIVQFVELHRLGGPQQ